jgi:hypothetical protein
MGWLGQLLTQLGPPAMSAYAPLLGLSRHDEYRCVPHQRRVASLAFERPAIVLAPTRGCLFFIASAASATSTSKGRGCSISTRHAGAAHPPGGSSHTICRQQSAIMHSSQTGWSSPTGSHSMTWRRAQRSAGGHLPHTTQSSSGIGMAATP